jgi:peptide/nickel transport system ATP-binding protein
MTAFDPLFTIGAQIVEVLTRHAGLARGPARTRAIDLLNRVGIADAALRADQFPHELSGGMRQRAMIAMALACDPLLLIADEPTTALDVTVQAQILDLLKDLQAANGMAILLITHDLGVAAAIADRLVVMYAGRVVEQGTAERVFLRPAHPYTRGLLQSVLGAFAARGAPLPAIAGAIPALSALPSGCRFHPRCARATAQCRLVAPPLEAAGEEGAVACWHPHHDAIAAPALVAPEPVAPTRPETVPLVEVHALSRHYGARGGRVVRAVDGVSLTIGEGETFGLVGESGSGKSTLGRLILNLEPASGGYVRFAGADPAKLDKAGLRTLRRQMQVVFQDPYGSLDTRWTIGRILAEPFAIHGIGTRGERPARVAALLDLVGLDPVLAERYPHQLSGGQRQRVAIARAMALEPRFLVADEAVSALDVSVRAQVLNLLQDLQRKLGLASLFIGHDLHVVRHVSDRIGVMYLGRLVEVGPSDALFAEPAHPYTRALIAAIPRPDPRGRQRTARLEGEIPSAAALPAGCRFHTRCPLAVARCREEAPLPRAIAPGRVVECHLA